MHVQSGTHTFLKTLTRLKKSKYLQLDLFRTTDDDDGDNDGDEDDDDDDDDCNHMILMVTLMVIVMETMIVMMIMICYQEFIITSISRIMNS